MTFRSDDRAQSIQVGAVLLFGFLILALTLYQAEGVPQENKQVEFEHSQQVADEMVEVYNAVFDTVVTGEPRTASVTLGTDYNDRLYFIYPPPASGTLQTTGDESLRLNNVTAVMSGPTNQSFGNYWNNRTRSYPTQAITYEPNYRELEGAANYSIEYGMLAARYPEITQLRLAESHDPIVDGTEIDLVVFDGELQSVDTDTESIIPTRVTDSTTISVENDTEGPITLELPTTLPEESWNTSKPGSALADQPNVENVSVSGGVAEIELNRTREYELTLHKVNVGEEPTEPQPTYLRNVSYNGTHATFEIRTQFNDLADETREVAVYNTTEVTRNVSVVGGKRTLELDGGSINECGISMAEDVGTAEPYENVSFTPSCP